MPTEEELIQNFELDTSGIDPHNPEQNPAAPINGLSFWQRFAVKDIFDTQPKRRRAYLKSIGFDMSSDGEKIRPLRNKEQYDFEPIDPENVALGFIPVYNLFSAEGRQELLNDLGDVVVDVFIEGPTTALTTLAGASKAAALAAPAGAAVGGAAGTALLPGAGTAAGAATGATIASIIAAIPGAIGGGAAGKALVEETKKEIGDLFLNEEVPLDLQQTFYQSLTVGLLGAAGRGFDKVWRNWRGLSAKNKQKALKEAMIQKSNGTMNMELATDFAQNPQNYTPEAVEGANKRLFELQKEIFGTSVENPRSTRQLTGGIARDAIDPLNKQADLEIELLSKDPKFNFSFGEIKEALSDRLAPLRKKKFKTSEEKKVLQFVQKELERFKNTVTVKNKINLVGPDGQPLRSPEILEEINFKEGRDFLKSLHDAAFKEGPLKGSGILKRFTRDLKELADDKAALGGSRIVAINALRSKILSTYNNMQSIIKDGGMRNAFVGKDNLSKQRVQEMFAEMDRVLDTNMSEAVQTTQFQAAVERLYDTPSAFGSGSVLKDVAAGALKEARSKALALGSAGGAIGGFEGFQTGVQAGVLIGGISGAKKGAQFASPETLVKNFSKIKTRISDLQKDPTLRQQAFGVTPQTAAAQAGAQTEAVTGQEVPPEPQVFDAQTGQPAGGPQAPEAVGQPGPEPQAPQTPGVNPQAGLPDLSPEELDFIDSFELDTTGL